MTCGLVMDRGAAAVLAVAVSAAMIAVCAALIPVGVALAATHRADGAADAAALAAADVASGREAGVPCDLAGVVAVANGAQVVECEVEGMVVTVEVAVSVGLVPLSGRATAGPPTSGER